MTDETPLLCGRMGCNRFANPETGRCYGHDPKRAEEEIIRDEQARSMHDHATPDKPEPTRTASAEPGESPRSR